MATDTKNIIIREIQKKDNLRVEAIIRECLIEYGGDNREDTAWGDPYLNRFSEVYVLENNRYWVAENEDGLVVAGVGVGPLDGEDSICELQKMYCIKEYRGTGIATLLLKKAISFAKEHYSGCYLETLSNMDRAKNFYKKNGFMSTSETYGSTGHSGCEDHYIMKW